LATRTQVAIEVALPAAVTILARCPIGNERCLRGFMD
jgi:hypothetical protein